MSSPEEHPKRLNADTDDANGTNSETHALGPNKRKRKVEETDTQAPGAARRKVACETCRYRKIRCSRERPRCAFCDTRDGDCVYIETSEDRLTLDPATKLIIRRLDDILHSVDSLKGGNYVQQPSLPRTSTQETVSDQSRTFGRDHTALQAAEDYLTIPTCRASADTVLTWPIFRDRYETDALIHYQYQKQLTDSYAEAASTADAEIDGPAEETIADTTIIPILIDSFLQNVHTKNPILDVPALVTWGRRDAKHGITLDAPSCLVLLACALGSVSRPFNSTLRDFETYSSLETHDKIRGHSASVQSDELAAGECYYHLACQRIGLLKHSILGSQCHFFAAVYLMYTFRPLDAWSHFYQASSFYQFYLRGVGGPSDSEPDDHDLDRLTRITRSERRLEQTIYWSCFKSEIEMRIELPLALSTISSFEYPSMFPTPPNPAASAHMDSLPTAYEASAWHKVIDATYGSNIRELTGYSDIVDATHDTQNLIQHRGVLYNEEESWYYYLTEVALRRISNRIVNSFYRVPWDAWLEPERWITLAIEFAAQIDAWSANLPAAMQTFDASPLKLLDQRKASDALQSSTHELESRKDSVSKELSWCTENRLLEMRSWLYQPFLYCIIHQPLQPDGSGQAWMTLPENRATAFRELIATGVECNLRILHWRALFHRHHGIWFDIRAVITAVITLCALAKSGMVQVPMCLFFQESNQSGHERSCGTHQLPCISFRTIFDRLRYWEDETSDVRQSRILLEGLVENTRIELNLAA